jgi:hypothetical protein
MRYLRFLIMGILLLNLPGLMGKALAQIGLDATARAGYYTDNNDLFMGTGLNLNIATISACPNLEYVFVNNGDFYTLNLDGHLNLVTPPGTALWIGLGLARLYYNPDNGSSSRESGMNLLAGFELKMIPLRPYLQGKFIIADNSQFVIGAGIVF